MSFTVIPHDVKDVFSSSQSSSDTNVDIPETTQSTVSPFSDNSVSSTKIDSLSLSPSGPPSKMLIQEKGYEEDSESCYGLSFTSCVIIIVIIACAIAGLIGYYYKQSNIDTNSTNTTNTINTAKPTN